MNLQLLDFIPARSVQVFFMVSHKVLRFCHHEPQRCKSNGFSFPVCLRRGTLGVPERARAGGCGVPAH